MACFVYIPVKELKGFAKIFLKAGKSREATIVLDDKAYRYFNQKEGLIPRSLLRGSLSYDTFRSIYEYKPLQVSKEN